MTMTDPTVAGLMRCILEAPESDVPRMVLADWLEEHGDADRSAFIRCQVELAKLPICRYYQQHGADYWRERCRTCKPSVALRRRERELYDGALWLILLHELPGPISEEFDRWNMHDNWIESQDSHWRLHFRRGFVASLECRADAFLAHADALLWAPTREEACPQCKGAGSFDLPGESDTRWVDKKKTAAIYIDCAACKRTGRVRVANPVPMPVTAQPIEEVRLQFPSRIVEGVVVAGNLWWRLVGREARLPADRFRHPDEAIEPLLAAEWPWVTWHLPGGDDA